jgi:hypothetical protein
MIVCLNSIIYFVVICWFLYTVSQCVQRNVHSKLTGFNFLTVRHLYNMHAKERLHHHNSIHITLFFTVQIYEYFIYAFIVINFQESKVSVLLCSIQSICCTILCIKYYILL